MLERSFSDKIVVICALLLCVKKMWLHSSVVTHFWNLFYPSWSAKICENTKILVSVPWPTSKPLCVKILWLHPKFVKLLWLMHKYRSDLKIHPIWAININLSTKDQQDQLSDTSESYIHLKILFLVWRKCGYTKSRQPEFFEWTQQSYDQKNTCMNYQIKFIAYNSFKKFGVGP